MVHTPSFDLEQNTIRTVTVTLPDDIIDELRQSGPMDIVQVQFISRAMNRPPSPKRLTWSEVNRLTTDA